MTFDAYTIALYGLICKRCQTKAEDTDADRLAAWMVEHERTCPWLVALGVGNA